MMHKVGINFTTTCRPLILSVLAFIHISFSSPVVANPEDELFPATVPSNLCYLKTTRSLRFIGIKKEYNSAGTLFDGEYLITAGHNLYDSSWSKLLNVEVMCKSADGGAVTSVVLSDQIGKTRSVEKYNVNNHSFSYDFAFLRLSERINVAESIRLPSRFDINELNEIEVAGYPGGALRHGKGKVEHPAPSDHTFYYDVDTAKGMSGGAVWSTYDGKDILAGIHVAEGRARILDEGLLNDFDRWKITTSR